MYCPDSSFLLDYLDADRPASADAKAYLEAHPDRKYHVPAVAYFEVLRGGARLRGAAGVADLIDQLAWTDRLPFTPPVGARRRSSTANSRARGEKSTSPTYSLPGTSGKPAERYSHGTTISSVSKASTSRPTDPRSTTNANDRRRSPHTRERPGAPGMLHRDCCDCVPVAADPARHTETTHNNPYQRDGPRPPIGMVIRARRRSVGRRTTPLVVASNPDHAEHRRDEYGVDADGRDQRSPPRRRVGESAVERGGLRRSYRRDTRGRRSSPRSRGRTRNRRARSGGAHRGAFQEGRARVIVSVSFSSGGGAFHGLGRPGG